MAEGWPRPPGYHSLKYEVEMPEPVHRRRRSALYNEEFEAQLAGPFGRASRRLAAATSEIADLQEVDTKLPAPSDTHIRESLSAVSTSNIPETPIIVPIIASIMSNTSQEQATDSQELATTDNMDTFMSEAENSPDPIAGPSTTTMITVSPMTENNGPSSGSVETLTAKLCQAPNTAENDRRASAMSVDHPYTESVQGPTPNALASSSAPKLQEFICCRSHKAIRVQKPMEIDHPAFQLLCHMRDNQDFSAGVRQMGSNVKMEKIVCISMPHYKWRCFAWIDVGKPEKQIVEVHPELWKDPAYTQMYGYFNYKCKEHKNEIEIRAHTRFMPKLFKESQVRTDSDYKVEDEENNKEKCPDGDLIDLWRCAGSDTSQE